MKTRIIAKSIVACAALALQAPPVHGLWLQIYGVASGPTPGVYDVDLGTGAVTLHISTPSITWAGAAPSGHDSPTTIYGTPTGGSLYRIDLLANTVTPIGNYGGPLIEELAYDTADSVLYGTDGSSLYTINESSGAAIFVGPFGNGITGMSAMDSVSGRLYGVDSSDNSMCIIDPLSGGVIFSTPTNANITDLWFDVYYYHWRPYGSAVDPDRLIGFLPGAPSWYGTTLFDTSVDLQGLAPEPASLVLLAVGGLLALGRRLAPRGRQYQQSGGR